MIGIWNSTHSPLCLHGRQSLHFKSAPNINYDIPASLWRALTFDTVWALLVFTLLIFTWEPHWEDTEVKECKRVQKLPFGVTLIPLKCVAGCVCGAQVLLVTVYWCQNIPNTPFQGPASVAADCEGAKPDPLMLCSLFCCSSGLRSWVKSYLCVHL